MTFNANYPHKEILKYAESVLPDWLKALSNNIEIGISKCKSGAECHNGDVLVVYHTRENLENEYISSIMKLDIENEAEENMYLKVEDIDLFKGSLSTRLEKTKLWNYPPDVREDVKKARDFLKDFLIYDVSYGFSVLVPADEAETFLADGKNVFGIRRCEYHIL